MTISQHSNTQRQYTQKCVMHFKDPELSPRENSIGNKS